MRARGNNRAANDPVRRWENQQTWRTVSKAVRRRNPFCQAIEHGQQCNCPSTQVHHIQAPETHPELMIAWSNLVALCDRHHLPGKGDRGLFRYIPTVGFNDGELFPHDDIVIGPYASARTKRNDLEPTGTPGAKLFISSSLGDVDLGTQAELDDLLAGL
jgi:hypothetical protein